MTADRPATTRAPATMEHAVVALLHALHSTSQTFRARADENAALDGGSFARTQVLGQLGEGPQTVPAVARRLALTRQSVQSVMDRLLEAGMVERVPNPAHRASWRFRLTAAGTAHVEGVRTRAASVYEAVVQAFGADGIEQITAELTRLRELASALPRAGAVTPER